MDRNLREAIRNEDLEYVKEYIDNNGSLEVRDENDWTPLYTAVYYNKLDVVRLLLTMQSIVDDQSSLDNGANIEATCANYWIPLDRAVYDNNYEMVKLLLTYGANSNTKHNYDYWSPLHRAVFCNRYEITKLLLTHGADRNALDKEGRRPINLTNDKKMIALLETWQDLLEIKEPDT